MSAVDRSLIGRLGAHASWSRTVDRSARTDAARRNSPSSVEWHLARLDPKFADANEDQRRSAAESAREAYFARLALKSAESRRKGRAA